MSNLEGWHDEWHKVWTEFAESLQKHVPEQLNELAGHSGTYAGAWPAFLDRHPKLAWLAMWGDVNPLADVPTDASNPDLSMWPQDLTPPPPEPPGLHDDLLLDLLDSRREDGDMPRIVLAATGLVAVGYARAVREAQEKTP